MFTVQSAFSWTIHTKWDHFRVKSTPVESSILLSLYPVYPAWIVPQKALWEEGKNGNSQDRLISIRISYNTEAVVGVSFRYKSGSVSTIGSNQETNHQEILVEHNESLVCLEVKIGKCDIQEIAVYSPSHSYLPGNCHSYIYSSTPKSSAVRRGLGQRVTMWLGSPISSRP